MGSILSKAIEGTTLSGLDKSLGLILGLLQTYFVMSTIYLSAFVLTDGILPKILDHSHAKPYMLEGAEFVRRALPKNFRPHKVIRTDYTYTSYLTSLPKPTS